MNGRRVIVMAAAALAAAALALGLWTLLEGRADIAGQTVLGEGALDMVLIDIEDQDAATHYHVNALGVYVLAVDQASEAYAAGVRSGDRIVSANGVPVTSTGEFGLLRAELARGGKARDVARRVQSAVRGWNGKELYALIPSARAISQ